MLSYGEVRHYTSSGFVIIIPDKTTTLTRRQNVISVVVFGPLDPIASTIVEERLGLGLV